MKKATGLDNISAKIIKACAPAVNSISNLVNISFRFCESPAGLKGAHIIPFFKRSFQ